ncbi:MAG: toprim domain-containing protein [Gammaproteobacteria bacterium]|nr:toprim domain-containing protein [Gammaproteobacteria bacterium]
MYSAKDIVGLLNQNVDRVIRHLLPNGNRKGKEWCVGSVDGETGKSLKICLEGDKTGIWFDFAAGQGGDLLNLWCDCRNLSIREAILEIKQWLGITSPAFEPQKRSNWVKPVFKNETSLVYNSAVARYLMEERKLKLETLNKFQIMEAKNQIVFPYYMDNELILIKYRLLDKKTMWTSSDSEPCLFGWQAVSKAARILALVEGEIDAMTLEQYNLGFAVLSVPFGGGKGAKQQWIENEFDRITVFDEIFLCLDNDPEGHVATNELIERLGRHRCRIVQLPYKDANECLKNGVTSDEMKKCFENAKTLDPDELKPASLYIEQVIKEFYPTNTQPLGYSLPWGKISGKINFRPSELSLWTGYNGHGKSLLLGQVMLHSIQEGAKICIASLELKPKSLLFKLTRQASGLRNPTEEYIRAIHQWYDNHLWIFDLVGTTKTAKLLEVFQYARQRYGVDIFVIDSLMKCGLIEDDYNAQKLFVDQLCDFKNAHNCHIHLVAHPRKGKDENTLPGKLDMKGSGSISDLADNCFSVFRNKMKEDEISKLGRAETPESILEKFDCLLACSKQRNGEWEGKVTLWFNKDSLQYLENRQHKPTQFVAFSNQQIAS